jgi:hypothetical protein
MSQEVTKEYCLAALNNQKPIKAIGKNKNMNSYELNSIIVGIL